MGTADVVFGRVVAIHIDDEVINGQGRIDVLKIQPLARMGYYNDTFVERQFQMAITGNSKALLAGLEGSADKAAQPHFPADGLKSHFFFPFFNHPKRRQA